MAVPVSQMYTVAKYVITQKVKKTKRYPARADARAIVSL